jgi:8-oxo-dGTP pyrophosphatase MutT (NUDIX family)
MLDRHLKGEPVTAEALEAGFLRHIAACRSAVLPGERVAFQIGAVAVGWLAPAFAARLERCPEIRREADALSRLDPGALPDLARELAAEGYYRWRDEAFDVRASAEAPVLAQLDRGAVPAFGVLALGVHVNGLVRRPDGLHLWIARRAADKALDPGKLDHITAGGVPSGLTPADTLVKEAQEEAAIPAALSRAARPVGEIGYAMDRPEGLRRDHLYCYDLDLPADFVPHAADGEVAGFELWPIRRAAEAVAGSEVFKFNVNLVLIDLFIRTGIVTGAPAARLRRALAAGAG